MAKGVKTGGRKKGTPNKLTSAAKEAFRMAFSEVGGVEALTEWARENPTEFYKLYARLIPVEVSGDPENPVQHDVKISWHVVSK